MFQYHQGSQQQRQQQMQLLGNLLRSKTVKAKIPEKGVMRAGEGNIRADEGAIRTSQNF